MNIYISFLPHQVMKMKKFSILVLLSLFILLNLLAIIKDSIFDDILSRLVNPQEYTKGALTKISNKDPLKGVVTGDMPNSRFLGGLLSDEFDGNSCQSRYQSNFYRKTHARVPSFHLISKLRSYESLHKKCGPNTNLYNKTLEILKFGGQNITSRLDCKYVIWIPYEGLGNRIITLASTFLYALLTNRVLLIANGTQIQNLFCEPFPDVSWLLPTDFPIIDLFTSFHQKSPQSYGNFLKNNAYGNSGLPPFLYLHLAHDSDENDKLFYCDQDQTLLQNIPWLIAKSNQYFLPALFLIPSFQQQLNNLFPEKETVFHHLGRYLFHPTNSVWELITRYYNAYLAKADEKLGIQIRVFNERINGTFKRVLNQILDCTITQNLLPEINKIESIIKKTENQSIKAVMITSLRPNFYDEIRNMYLNNATITGEMITIHQPSQEGIQLIGNLMHDRKALAEIYLLSMTDKLVTSARSTFGYVAQSLGGLKPWILGMSYGGNAPNPPCQRADSMEPCFQFPPPILACRKEKVVATDNHVPYLRHCEDLRWGLKMFHRDN